MKNYAIEIKWGIIFTVATILWMLLEKTLGWHDELIAQHPMYTNLFAIVAIAIYVFAILDKKKNFFNNQMTWTQGFISGMILSIIVALLSPISQYICLEIISPNYFENVIDYAVGQERMSRENAEAYFNLTSYIIQSFFFAIAVGIITSALVALFLRTKEKDLSKGNQ